MMPLPQAARPASPATEASSPVGLAAPECPVVPAGSPPVCRTPIVVLDTNVVLDWLVFRNPGVQAVAAAIEQGALRWLASAAMQDELMHVLGRGVLQSWQPDDTALRGAWARWATPAPVADALPASLGLVCRDGDDQKFIDLAVHGRAQWLLSRDRAVLALARRARPRGLMICPPEHWPEPAQVQD